MSLQILDTHDQNWLSLYNQLGLHGQDVFYHPGFARACQQSLYSSDRVQCAAWSKEGRIVLYPHVLRTFSHSHLGIFRDMTGLYGRGGITTNGTDSHSHSSLEFLRELRAFCVSERIICSFDRFHPVLMNHAWAEDGARIIAVGGFVVVDLRPPIEEIESQYAHMHRKSIKKAERAGVRVFLEDGLGNLDTFLKIYHATLRRNKAENFYFFPPEFYRCLADELPGSFRFYYARFGDEVVSCELVLMKGLYGHSYLGGTLMEYQSVRPNVLLKRDLIRDLRRSGCYYYLLGGGLREGDGIFTYKAGFGPQGVIPSYVGGTVYDDSAYASLRNRLQMEGRLADPRRFQFYEGCVDRAQHGQRAACGQ